jgi:hypothetical protein
MGGADSSELCYEYAMFPGQILHRCLIVSLFATVAVAVAGIQPEPVTMSEARIETAVRLMEQFTAQTRAGAGQPPRRYLWTDAFAVCNDLGLARATGNRTYRERALALVDQVHHTLGRHRPDDHRHGWISGLGEAEGETHPTAGGLRIGKPLPERAPGEPLDERREWDRDGQYFHYLTRWMHALDQVARATGEARYSQWARELDAAAFRAFTYVPAPPLPARRMYWKMSIDLSRPLVGSMGQQDPLDGYLTTLQLHATAVSLAQAQPDLEEESREYAAMVRRGDWATDDPLGIGGLLVDAWRVQQLSARGVDVEPHLLERLLDAARTGLARYVRGGDLQLPARYRLAFRELGLAIGLHAVERIQATTPDQRSQLEALAQYLPLAGDIEAFWLDPMQQSSTTWIEHQDINTVMLAASLVPDGYLDLR